MSLGVLRGVKKTGRSLHYKNKNFGVERCELHVWKGLSEWNNFKKACNGLKSILFMLYRKTWQKYTRSLLLSSWYYCPYTYLTLDLTNPNVLIHSINDIIWHQATCVILKCKIKHTCSFYYYIRLCPFGGQGQRGRDRYFLSLSAFSY